MDYIQGGYSSSLSRLPTLAELALRLLCLRQGIADVERLFSVLRGLQTKERLTASMTTLEKEFVIAANRHVTDLFAKNTKSL